MTKKPREKRSKEHTYAVLIGRTFRWVEFVVIATALGHKSPRNKLEKLMRDKWIKQVGRGEYMLLRI